MHFCWQSGTAVGWSTPPPNPIDPPHDSKQLSVVVHVAEPVPIMSRYDVTQKSAALPISG